MNKMDKQKAQAKELRKPKKTSASNVGGAAVGGGS